MKLVGKNKDWRVAAFIIAVVWIAYMWINKDIVSTFTTMPKEQAFAVAATSIAVTLIKVVVIAGLVLLVKWAWKKISNKE